MHGFNIGVVTIASNKVLRDTEHLNPTVPTVKFTI